MRIAIMSDSHDNPEHLQRALQRAKALGCEHLIFLGDFVQPRMLGQMLAEWQAPLDFVLGNNEYESESFEALARRHEGVKFHGYYGDIELQNRRLFFTHTPDKAISRGIRTGIYDAVFFGHTHAATVFVAENKTLVVNPGELYGRREAPGFAVYCTVSNTVTFYKI